MNILKFEDSNKKGVIKKKKMSDSCHSTLFQESVQSPLLKGRSFGKISKLRFAPNGWLFFRRGSGISFELSGELEKLFSTYQDLIEYKFALYFLDGDNNKRFINEVSGVNCHQVKQLHPGAVDLLTVEGFLIEVQIVVHTDDLNVVSALKAMFGH